MWTTICCRPTRKRCIILEGNVLKLKYLIPNNDFLNVGMASSNMKKVLKQIGVHPSKIKNASVAMYEAEINACIHAGGGNAEIEVYPYKIIIKIIDNGPGIPNVDLAMQEGYSTASDEVRQMGFGAGLGLPNIKKHADEFEINTIAGEGTEVTIIV